MATPLAFAVSTPVAMFETEKGPRMALDISSKPPLQTREGFSCAQAVFIIMRLGFHRATQITAYNLLHDNLNLPLEQLFDAQTVYHLGGLQSKVHQPRVQLA